MTRLQTLLGILAIAALVAVGAYYVNYRQAGLGRSSGTIQGKPQDTAKETAPAMAASKFIIGNINALSPVMVSSSTKLSVTSITLGSGTGTVSFSDGMRTYTADFTFSAGATSTTVSNLKLRK